MKNKLFLFSLVFIGFFHRIFGLSENYSFWTDENHAAIFVRAILKNGEPVLVNGYSTGTYQWLLYWLDAIPAKIFGLNEFAIRLPSVLFGVSTILVTYLLGKEIFNRKVGFLSAFFITFLNIEILFSRQARPYQAFQLFYLLGFYFVYRLVKEKKFNWCYFLGFLGCGILASLMHGLGLIIFFSSFIYVFIFKASWFVKKLMLPVMVLFVLFGLVFKVQILFFISQMGKINNLYYYRIFLTHNYLHICFLALIGGFFLLWQKKYQQFILFIIVFLVQLIIVSFFLPQPFIRYLYPIFGFIIILSAYGLENLFVVLSRLFKNNRNFQTLIFILLVVLVIIPNNKFSIIPKQEYSLNADMQEVPEVDWKKIYGFVKDKLNQNPDSVVVTNWNDLPIWYLGEGKLDFMVRKIYSVSVDSFSGAKIINNLEDFEKIVKEYPKGLLVLDSWDDQVPDGIREFSRDNLKSELEINSLYPIQPRLWPVSVYSWGIL